MTDGVLSCLVARWNGEEAAFGPDSVRWLTRTDYEPIERWDVPAAQEAYLRGGEEAVCRWSAIYRKLPPERRVWDVRRTIDGRETCARADEHPLAAIWYHQETLARLGRWDAKARELSERLSRSFPTSHYTAIMLRDAAGPSGRSR